MEHGVVAFHRDHRAATMLSRRMLACCLYQQVQGQELKPHLLPLHPAWHPPPSSSRSLLLTSSSYSASSTSKTLPSYPTTTSSTCPATKDHSTLVGATVGTGLGIALLTSLALLIWKERTRSKTGAELGIKAHPVHSNNTPYGGAAMVELASASLSELDAQPKQPVSGGVEEAVHGGGGH